MNGKGDLQRPRLVSKKQYDTNFEAVFKKKKQNTTDKK